jgi:peptide/nickel transport system ATP-binding protein/oligopeptide transport system ATP-binding protein
MSAPLLSIRNLTVRIGNITPVQDVSFDVRAGEVLGVVGESGSGKSLTLRAILRLQPDIAQTAGSISWQGRNLMTLAEPELRALRGSQIAIVFQEPMTALDPVLTVGRQITESLTEHLGLRGRAARARAAEVLDLVGIPDARRRLASYPHEFSGGMRQRAMLAIALAAGPKLLLADEPTTALDVTIQDQILKLLHSRRNMRPGGCPVLRPHHGNRTGRDGPRAACTPVHAGSDQFGATGEGLTPASGRDSRHAARSARPAARLSFRATLRLGEP